MTKFRPLALSLSVLGCAASTVAVAQPTYRLRMNLKPGQTFVYRMNMDMASSGQQRKMGMKMAMKATAVNAGKTTMKTTFLEFTQDGRPAPAETMKALSKMYVVSVLDETGKTLSTKMVGAPAGTPAPANGTSTVYPARALRVGDTWSAMVDMQGRKVQTKYRLAQVGSFAGRKAAKLEARPNIPGQSGPPQPMIVWVELASGMPLHVDANMLIGGVKMRMTMARA